MKEYEYLDELISRYPVLAPVKADIRTAYETVSYTHLTLPTT